MIHRQDILELVSRITLIEPGMTEQEAESVRDAIGEDLYHLICATVPADQLEDCINEVMKL